MIIKDRLFYADPFFYHISYHSNMQIHCRIESAILTKHPPIRADRICSFKFPAVVAVIYHQLGHTAVDADVLACNETCFAGA